jgi:rhodanese-related sulfurtransferase
MGWLRTVFGTGRGIGPREADGLMRSGALLLDVREPAEWRAGHAPAARHIPLGELEGRLGELPRDQTVVAVCRSGGRSARATTVLTRSGFQALNLNGGMRAWASVGLAVQTDEGPHGRRTQSRGR